MIEPTRSKAVEHARGWVAVKIGFFDMVSGVGWLLVKAVEPGPVYKWPPTRMH